MTWATDVAASTAKLHVEIDPGDEDTGYRFDYLSELAYEANIAQGKDGFAGAVEAPPAAKAEAEAGSVAGAFQQMVTGLKPETIYRYRASAKNLSGSAIGLERTFVTRDPGGPLRLPDGRGWEMVSPIDKNGGAIQGFGASSGGGVLQAAAAGDAVTYSSASSFGQGGQGAPGASQYLSSRTAAGWSTENITTPLFSGGYGENPDGVPYQLFSAGLDRGLLAGIPYQPLAGTGAPAGFQDYYLRDDAGGGFETLLTAKDVASLAVAPRQFELSLAGASPDLGHVVLSTCAALTADATEIPAGSESCDAESPNLYEWSASGGLRLVNLRPGESIGTPGARLAAPNGAISEDGARVYWSAAGNVYLREGGARTVQVDLSRGGGGVFQTSTPDGSAAFFTKGGHLFRYDAATEAVTDLTPGGGVEGVLGASSDGEYVYYLTSDGLFLSHNGTDVKVAAAADTVNAPPSTGTARVSADGTHVAFLSTPDAFLSTAQRSDFDNVDKTSGEPDREVYVYDADTGTLTCASCNPTRGRPVGPSSIPGAVANGQGEGATRIYKPRALSADGQRLFFDSDDKLASQDTNNADQDVYEWEALGTGSCLKTGGCVQLISDGQSSVEASFVDASANGADAFFLTDRSLVPSDPGSVDLYDAREGGGFPESPTPIPCEGDSCQALPPPPDDPSPGTLVPSTGNPPVHFSVTRHKPRHKDGHRRHKRHRRLVQNRSTTGRGGRG